jgi:hypothetical protein
MAIENIRKASIANGRNEVHKCLRQHFDVCRRINRKEISRIKFSISHSDCSITSVPANSYSPSIIHHSPDLPRSSQFFPVLHSFSLYQSTKQKAPQHLEKTDIGDEIQVNHPSELSGE